MLPLVWLILGIRILGGTTCGPRPRFYPWNRRNLSGIPTSTRHVPVRHQERPLEVGAHRPERELQGVARPCVAHIRDHARRTVQGAEATPCRSSPEHPAFVVPCSAWTLISVGRLDVGRPPGVQRRVLNRVHDVLAELLGCCPRAAPRYPESLLITCRRPLWPCGAARQSRRTQYAPASSPPARSRELGSAYCARFSLTMRGALPWTASNIA